MNDRLKQSRLGPAASAGRRLQVAGVIIAALVIGLGYGYAQSNATSATTASESATQATTTPVSTATLVCPMVKDESSTNIMTFSPGTVSASGNTSETVTQQQGNSSSLFTAGKPGTLSSATGISGGSPTASDISNPVIAHVGGAYAPGFAMTETMPSGSSAGQHGLASTDCGSPDTDFWFVGLGTDASPYSMLNMANVDSSPASVTVTMYTVGGPLAQSEAQPLQGITIPANSEADELVNVLDNQKQGAPYAVHVVATAGRIAASVLDWDGNGGGRDFIGSQKSATSLVFPGIPQQEDNEQVKLSLLAPDGAASVALRWIGQHVITPAIGTDFSGNLIQGKVATVDLSSVPISGEYAALEVCGAQSAASQCLPITGNSGSVPVVGEIKITQSDSHGSDTAFITPAQPLAGDGIVADNPVADDVLTLTNTGSADAVVKVTQTPDGASPSPSSATVTVPAGQTVSVPITAPKKRLSAYALTVTPLDGAQDVYAARIAGQGGELTIQSLTTTPEVVTIPAVGQDSSGLVPQG